MLRRAGIWLIAVCCSVAVYAAILVTTDNFHTVLAGTLYRSAQPSAQEIAEWRSRYGISTVINLRGPHPGAAWYESEKAAAAREGIRLVDYKLSADRQLSADQIEELLALLKQAKTPILIHCLRGADRSGIASALYVSGVAGGSEAAAEFQLTPFYGHLPLWFLPVYAMDRSFESAEPRLGFLGS